MSIDALRTEKTKNLQLRIYLCPWNIECLINLGCIDVADAFPCFLFAVQLCMGTVLAGSFQHLFKKAWVFC